MLSACRNLRTLVVLTALGLSAGSCATSSLTAPERFQGITRIVLRAWEDTRVGLPPLAELFRGTPVVGRFGFISLRHGGPGYFITNDAGRAMLRPASAEEIAAFLAFFGITVKCRPTHR